MSVDQKIQFFPDYLIDSYLVRLRFNVKTCEPHFLRMYRAEMIGVKSLISCPELDSISALLSSRIDDYLFGDSS